MTHSYIVLASVCIPCTFHSLDILPAPLLATTLWNRTRTGLGQAEVNRGYYYYYIITSTCDLQPSTAIANQQPGVVTSLSAKT